MAQRSPRTIKLLGFGQRYIDNRIDEFEELAIGRFPVEIVSLIANRVAPAAFHSVIVVVEYFVEWPAINHGLVALETFALFSFERFDRDRAKLDPLHRTPRLRVSFQD